MASPPKIIVTEPLTEEAIAWLSERAAVVQMTIDDRCFASELADADALVVRTYTKVDQELLSRAPCLRVVGRGGTGLDNIDLEACAARSIMVVHTPDANRQAVVEYVASILLSAVRPLPSAVAGGLSRTAWADARRIAMAPTQLSECTLGIIGMGRIGRRVAQVAAALGCRVQYHDVIEVHVSDRHGAIELPLYPLLETSDIVSLHVDGRASNHHFLGASQLHVLQDHALLINTSRGCVIDGDALAHLLGERPHMRAILDVHEVEPIPAGAALLDRPNAVLLPHAASRTEAAQRAMSWVVRDVLAALAG